MFMFLSKKMRKNKKGFTLIELIVVIAILGILALIAIPRLAGFREQARQANDEELAAIVANSAAIWFANHPEIVDIAGSSDDDSITEDDLIDKLEDDGLLDSGIDTISDLEGLLESNKYSSFSIDYSNDTVTVYLDDNDLTNGIEYEITK